MRPIVVALSTLSLLAANACGDSSTSDGADGATGDTAVGDTAGGDGTGEDTGADTTTTVVTSCLAPEGADPSGTDALSDPLGEAAVTVADRDACHRTYSLSSTATRRDDLPASPREVEELEGFPTLRSGHDLLDALFALALAEARENMVETIHDGSFSQGGATACGDGGCFETGRKWTYVWTRDTAYAVDLGLAAVDPTRAANSLRFKLSARRDGGDVQVVQDTGSGGSYPVSTDRVVWALGAWALLQQLDGDARDGFAADAGEALANTVEHDRAVVYDVETGLYRGETSFLDWREQTYPAWTQLDVTDIATGAALSTNVLHLRALEVAAALSEGEAATRYQGWADALRTAIHDRFWDEERGLFSAFLPNTLDLAPVNRYDLLGEALAVLAGVASPAEARRVLESYPSYGPGTPVIWPQQQRTAIYHNRAEWPFVDAYWLRAAAVAKNDAVADKMVAALTRAAALNLSNMENLEAWTGAPYVEDDLYSGPVVNSQRQLWSVGAYLSLVQSTLFGLEPTPEGLKVAPYITHGMRRTWLAGTDQIVLNDFGYRGRKVTVVVSLPSLGEATGGGSYRVKRLLLDGQVLEGTVITLARLAASNRVDVELEDDPEAPAGTALEVDGSDWQLVFGPRTPQLKSVTAAGDHLQLELGLGGESEEGLLLHVYRDGELVATGLPGSTSTWSDPDSDPSAAASPCYAVEASFTHGGNRSQHSRAVCWWGGTGEAIQVVDAGSFTAVGGSPVTNYGRFHYQEWGDPGDTLTASGFSPLRSGPALVQVRFGNGAGPINTGITCAVKRVTVYEEQSGAEVGGGLLVMPQLGSWERWSLSSFVPVVLDGAKTYRFVLSADDRTVNMSAFAHFAQYNGTGGEDGRFERVNIAELRVLVR
ncbi:MAG: hypothetical protein EP329_16475 [Deltaproteobacteria bacterium]|nr:MAG: hypothetical protein EP329_16475 [Deltaproteobacteria bacterium]